MFIQCKQGRKLKSEMSKRQCFLGLHCHCDCLYFTDESCIYLLYRIRFKWMYKCRQIGKMPKVQRVLQMPITHIEEEEKNRLISMDWYLNRDLVYQVVLTDSSCPAVFVVDRRGRCSSTQVRFVLWKCGYNIALMAREEQMLNCLPDQTNDRASVFSPHCRSVLK